MFFIIRRRFFCKQVPRFDRTIFTRRNCGTILRKNRSYRTNMRTNHQACFAISDIPSAQGTIGTAGDKLQAVVNKGQGSNRALMPFQNNRIFKNFFRICNFPQANAAIFKARSSFGSIGCGNRRMNRFTECPFFKGIRHRVIPKVGSIV